MTTRRSVSPVETRIHIVQHIIVVLYVLAIKVMAEFKIEKAKLKTK